MNKPHIGFESENDEVQEPVHDVKLNPLKSRFTRKAHEKEKFEEYAKDTHERLEGHQSAAIDLGKKFINMLKDKTLMENKGPIEKSLEKEVINKLITFAIEVNNDQEEQEGMGSVGICTLLINAILKVRDNSNNIDYRLSKLEEKVNEILSKIPAAETKNRSDDAK